MFPAFPARHPAQHTTPEEALTTCSYHIGFLSCPGIGGCRQEDRDISDLELGSGSTPGVVAPTLCDLG